MHNVNLGQIKNRTLIKPIKMNAISNPAHYDENDWL